MLLFLIFVFTFYWMRDRDDGIWMLFLCCRLRWVFIWWFFWLACVLYTVAYLFRIALIFEADIRRAYIIPSSAMEGNSWWPFCHLCPWIDTLLPPDSREMNFGISKFPLQRTFLVFSKQVLQSQIEGGFRFHRKLGMSRLRYLGGVNQGVQWSLDWEVLLWDTRS